MRLEYLPIDSITQAFRNPKDHDIGAIMESIRRFGFVSPAVRNEETGKLVAGHGRLQALRLLWEEGGKPPKGINGGGKSGVWKMPVITGISFDSDEEAEAYLIADNRLTELGGWDESQLVDALKDLAAYDHDSFEVTGFDDGDVESMIANLEGITPPKATKTDGQARACPFCGEELP